MTPGRGRSRVARGGDKGFSIRRSLYPYFLGVIYTIFGHSLLAVRLIQIALGSAACVLLARAGESFISRRAGLAAGLLLALYPTANFFEALNNKSVVDTFFI